MFTLRTDLTPCLADLSAILRIEDSFDVAIVVALLQRWLSPQPSEQELYGLDVAVANALLDSIRAMVVARARMGKDLRDIPGEPKH